MKITQTKGEEKHVVGEVGYKIEDKNFALMHSFRQICLREIPIFSFSVKIYKNDSEYQDEILTQEIMKLKINQKILYYKYKNKEYVPFYANDIKDTEDFWEYEEILICVLRKDQQIHIELSFVEDTKKSSSNTAFMSISNIAQIPNKDGHILGTGILLGALTFSEIVKKYFSIIEGQIKNLPEELKRVKKEYSSEGGCEFKTTEYDYVILNVLVDEILLLYPDIKFCATTRYVVDISEDHLIIFDEEGEELKKIKTACDTILKRLKYDE
jgi:hypothetical protein